MSLSLKAELEAWANALNAYDEEDFAQALELFEPIADTSRILTNIGLILATVGEHERAVENFRRATELDNYLAIAYFQSGVSSFLLFDYEAAFDQFETALMWLRGNQAINYEQLGLNFRLYTAEILFNRGLCLLNLGRTAEGMADLEDARKEKATPEHNVIEDAIRDQGDGYTVFSIPVGVVFRPNPNKIKNLQTKDYLGKARLISKDGAKYQTFDGVDPNDLAFRPQPPKKDEGAKLGRSSSDIGGTSAPRNPAGLARAATTVATTRPSVVDPPRRPSMDEPPSRPSLESRPLGRANTTIRPMARPLSPPKPRSPERRPNEEFPMSRSPEPIGAGAGPARGLSVRRPALKPTTTESVYDAYASPSPPQPLMRAATMNASANDWGGESRGPSRSASTAGSRSQGSYLSRSPSQYTVRRKGTMRSRTGRTYEDEEGYVSGEGEEIPFEVTKIRVRLHFNGSLRGMAILPDITCEEFMDQVCSKFGKEYGDLVLKFSDEDGAKVTLVDESDFELAIETTKAAAAKGKEMRLEIWCEAA